MARILIFQGPGGLFFPLQNCLKDRHDIYRAHATADAMKILQECMIGLIICSVYDDTTDAFMFLYAVKQDPSFRVTPLLFFSRERSSLATRLDPTIQHAALLCGADKYLSMDSFCDGYSNSCDACPFPGKLCDYPGLSRAVEDMLAAANKLSDFSSRPDDSMTETPDQL